MKKLNTLVLTTMIALALMLAVPSAMAAPDKAKSNEDKSAVERVLKCIERTTSPETPWFGLPLGECIAVHRAAEAAGKKPPGNG